MGADSGPVSEVTVASLLSGPRRRGVFLTAWTQKGQWDRLREKARPSTTNHPHEQFSFTPRKLSRLLQPEKLILSSLVFNIFFLKLFLKLGLIPPSQAKFECKSFLKTFLCKGGAAKLFAQCDSSCNQNHFWPNTCYRTFLFYCDIHFSILVYTCFYGSVVNWILRRGHWTWINELAVDCKKGAGFKPTIRLEKFCIRYQRKVWQFTGRSSYDILIKKWRD